MKRALARACVLLAASLTVGCGDEVIAPGTLYPQEFRAVAAGYEHTCATTTAGRTFCWGNPWQSRLGSDGEAPECEAAGCTQPLPIRRNLPFTALEAGEAHTCGLVDRQAWCWGFNRFGQLGDDRTVLTNCWDDVPFLCSIDPSVVAVGTPLALVTAARMHSCALTTSGRALCWGWNIAGQLGRGFKDDAGHPDPAHVDTDLLFTDLSTAYGHTCGITPDGAAYCWGANGFGSLGTGDTEDRPSPAAVVGGHAFRRIATAGHFTCGITTDDEIYCWGWAWEGRLGTGNMNDRTEPTLTLMPERAVDIEAGHHHACAIGESGTLYCWGANHDGQLGIAGLGFRLSPQPVAALPQPVVQVSGGYIHTCAITADARLYCWGDNSSRQLGFGEDPYRDVPLPVNP